MVNYQNGMIYKIAHRYSPYVYIGSTTNFSRRKQEHKSICLNEKSKQYNQKVYQTIRELGGWDNFEMVLVAKCPCDDKKELHAKEFEYQQLFNVNMNTYDAISGIDPSDPEYVKKYHKKYQEKNSVKLSKYKKIYQEKNSEEIKEKKKEYYQKNKEVFYEKGKIYREKNSEIIKKKKLEKIECECGYFSARCQMSRHRRSQRHLKLMSS